MELGVDTKQYYVKIMRSFSRRLLISVELMGMTKIYSEYKYLKYINFFITDEENGKVDTEKIKYLFILI